MCCAEKWPWLVRAHTRLLITSITARESSLTPHATASSRGSPAWRRSAVVEVKPKPWRRCKNAWQKTWTTLITGRFGRISKSCSRRRSRCSRAISIEMETEMADQDPGGAVLPDRGSGWRGRWQQATRAHLLRNIATAVSGSAGAQAINLALIPVIMRIYGTEAFGVVGSFQRLTIILIPACALTWPMSMVLTTSYAV